MTTASISDGDFGLPRSPRFKENRQSVLAVGGLLVLLLLPVWWWPLVASQDGPCHLYSATVLNESLAGNGPSTAVYEVAWRPTPNWAGALLLMGLLKLLPLSVIPHVMLTITSVVLILATLFLRRQIARPHGFLWVAGLACCLATGRAWVMGFESFCLGSAVAIVILSLWQRYRERLDAIRSLAIAALLTLAFFCHLVPWAFAAGAIGVLALTGSVQGRARRLSWTGAILITTLPCLFLYWSLSTAHTGGFKFDWYHLQGFHPAHLNSWKILVERVDCIDLIRYQIPFDMISPSNILNPFFILSAAVVLQALATLRNDCKSKNYQHIGWPILGFGGFLMATFMPDGTFPNGNFLPLRVMLLSLTMLIVYARFDVGRRLTVATSFLVAAGFGLHIATLWDYTASTNRHLQEVRSAAAAIPPGQRIFQVTLRGNIRFQSIPILHSDGYLALSSHGILLSNYQAGLYYFHVKLQPSYPESLVFPLGHPELFVQDDGYTIKFFSEHEQFIDVLVLSTSDQEERFLSLVQQSFSKVLWHGDGMWVLTRE